MYGNTERFMKKKILLIATLALSLLYFFSSCNTGTSINNSSISADSSYIAVGEVSFNKNCSGCHNFRQDGIGPQLGGLTTNVSADWIHQFITDSKKMIVESAEMKLLSIDVPVLQELKK